MRRLGAAIVAVTLLLTGCVRVTSETTLGEDDTFSQHAVVAMTSQAATALRQQLNQLPLPDGVDLPEVPLDPSAVLDPDAVRAQLADLEEAYPGSVAVTAYEDDDGREGVEIVVTDVPIGAAADAAGASPFTAGTSIAREGDDYVVEIETGAASQLSAAGADAGDLTLLENAVEVSVAFTFPGLVREASAGTVESNTVTLGLGDLLGADTIRVVGGATDQIDWGPWLRWGLVSLGALILVGGASALVIQDRRRRGSSHLPPPRESHPGGPGTLRETDATSAGPAGGHADDAPSGDGGPSPR